MPLKFTDQTGWELQMDDYPQKIISLVPSQTELLLDLGLSEKLVGRTKFCIHPEKEVKNIPVIGGTKNLRLDAIRAINPDLIIANKEENEKVQIERLSSEFNVWISDIPNFEAALEMISSIGKLTNRSREAELIGERIKHSIGSAGGDKQLSAVYIIWKEPLMTVGGDTFISDMMSKAGYHNVFKESSRYPNTSIDEIKELRPNYLFLSSEPFPFKERDASEFQKMLPNIKVVTVDGEMFSWYGSRMIKAFDYFRELSNYLKVLN